MKQKALEASRLPDLVTIKPVKGWVPLNLKDLWHYRELIYFLTWRDLKVRYKQSVLGVLWAILKPFMNMVVFTIFFGELAKVPSDGIPYPIFSYTGLLPWIFFASALEVSARSMLQSGSMVSKIYFPRIIVPLASVFANLVDFGISFIILIGMMIFYQIVPTANIFWLPVFLLLAMIAAIGVGLWFSALLVMYRDVNYLLPFITEIWKFISPVVYSATMIPEKWQWLYSLNPMAGVVSGFRWALLGKPETIALPGVLISAGISLAIFISGLYFFRRMERVFADMI